MRHRRRDNREPMRLYMEGETVDMGHSRRSDHRPATSRLHR
jgi:hypothetical protein